MLRRLQTLIHDKSGVAAIEFAFVFPVFIILLFGLIEYANYDMQSRRAAMAANFAAEYASRDDDGVLKLGERHVVEDIWMIMNPTAHKATALSGGIWASGYSRALASVRFEAAAGCKENCTFEPKVVWSFLVADSVRKPIPLSCTARVVANTAALTGGGIRQGTTGRTPVVVADFTYPYRPLLEGWLMPRIDLHVSAVRRTRSGTVLDHVPDGLVKRC